MIGKDLPLTNKNPLRGHPSKSIWWWQLRQIKHHLRLTSPIVLTIHKVGLYIAVNYYTWHFIQLIVISNKMLVKQLQNNILKDFKMADKYFVSNSTNTNAYPKIFINIKVVINVMVKSTTGSLSNMIIKETFLDYYKWKTMLTCTVYPCTCSLQMDKTVPFYKIELKPI